MHILAVRFSSLGDVALCLPTLRAVLDARPDWRITFITRPRFAPLFQNQERLSVMEADVDITYRGPQAMFQLARAVEKQFGKVDALVDLHDNLRTALLKLYFRTKGKRIYTYAKGRKEKKALLGNLKPGFTLPHTTERYLQAFVPLLQGAVPVLPQAPLFRISPEDKLLAERFIGSLPQHQSVVGIAPFAQYGLKCLSEADIRRYAREQVKAGNHVLWFGGGQAEKRKLDGWMEAGMTNLAGRFPLALELALLPRLDCMVAMDSGNMHLAALSGTKLISIWGPTHPALGFGPYQQPEAVIQKEMSCRPCSVFGNKPCHRKDHACMQGLVIKD